MNMDHEDQGPISEANKKKMQEARAKKDFNKTCDIAMNDRIHIVFDQIMDGVPTAEIIENIQKDYSVNRTQAYNYLRKAKDLRKGISRALAIGKYEEQKKRVLEEMWLLYETEATTVKQKMDLLNSFDKIAKGSVDIDSTKNHKWTEEKSDAELLKLVEGSKKNEEKK